MVYGFVNERWGLSVGWNQYIDVAEIVTAVSAVVAVVLATWLGRDAIRIAKSGNDTARQEFLYDQVERLLQTALELTSAATMFAGVDQDPASARRALRLRKESFDSRVEVLGALGLLPSSREVEGVQEFADALVRYALANGELHCDGRDILAPTIFDAQDDHTSEFLARLRTSYFTIAVDVREHLHDEPVYEEVLDDRVVPSAFEDSPAAAQRLRSSLLRADWESTCPDSLRLVLPWAQSHLRIVILDRDLDETPVQLRSTEMDGSYCGPGESPDWPVERVAAWLDNWSGGQSMPLDHTAKGDEAIYEKQAVEELADSLLDGLRAEFIDRLTAAVDRLQSDLSTPESESSRWWRFWTR